MKEERVRYTISKLWHVRSKWFFKEKVIQTLSFSKRKWEAHGGLVCHQRKLIVLVWTPLFCGGGMAPFAPTYTVSYHHLIRGLLLTLYYIFMWNTWPQANVPLQVLQLQSQIY